MNLELINIIYIYIKKRHTIASSQWLQQNKALVPVARIFARLNAIERVVGGNVEFWDVITLL